MTTVKPTPKPIPLYPMQTSTKRPSEEKPMELIFTTNSSNSKIVNRYPVQHHNYPPSHDSIDSNFIQDDDGNLLYFIQIYYLMNKI